MKNLAIALTLMLVVPALRADTFLFAGAQLELPEGWTVRTGKLATLLPPMKGAFLEVYDFSAVPPADVKVITERMTPRKNTTDVQVTKAEALEQNGLKGIQAEGKAKINDLPVRFRIVSLPMGKRAVLVVSFVSDPEVDKFAKDIDGILKSVRVAP